MAILHVYPLKGTHSSALCYPAMMMSLGMDTHLGTGTRITVPSTSGFRFMPLSLIALAAAAVLCKTDQKVKGIRK